MNTTYPRLVDTVAMPFVLCVFVIGKSSTFNPMLNLYHNIFTDNSGNDEIYTFVLSLYNI